MKKYYFAFILLVLITFFFTNEIQAQCAMCKMTAEAGTKAGNTQSLGVNKGILYLAFFPYLIIGTIAFLFWRTYKKRQKEEAEFAS